MADIRNVAFDVKKDEESTTEHRINATFDFQKLSRDDLIDWALKPVVINKQASLRKKSEIELANIAKTPQVFEVVKAGTKQASVTDETALMQMCQGDKARYDKLIEMYKDAATAMAKVREQMAAMGLK